MLSLWRWDFLPLNLSNDDAKSPVKCVPSHVTSASPWGMFHMAGRKCVCVDLFHGSFLPAYQQKERYLVGGKHQLKHSYLCGCSSHRHMLKPRGVWSVTTLMLEKGHKVAVFFSYDSWKS